MSNAPRFNFFRLVIRNLKKRPSRNMVTIITFAIIAATIFSTQYLISGAKSGLDKGTMWMGADLIVVPENYTSTGENSLLTGYPSMFFFDNSGFEQVSRIPGVSRASPQIYVSTLAEQSCCSGFIQLIAVDPERDFTLRPWLDQHPGIVMGKDDIIVGSKIDGEVGSDLKFYGHIFHVTGKLDPTGMMGIDTAVFTRMDDVWSMADESGEKAVSTLLIPEGMVSSVLVKLEPGASAAAVGNDIRMNIPGTRTITPGGLLSTITLNLAGITALLSNSGIVAALLSIPLLGILSVVFALELRREIVLLGALGVTKAFILQIMFAESFLSSVIGSLLGIGSASVILFSFQDFIAFSLEIPLSIPPILNLITIAAGTLVISLVIGGIGSFYPTIRIIRSEAYGKIRPSDSV